MKGMVNNMRKILFRGKRVYNGEWIYGSYVAGIKKSFIAIEQVYEIIPETIGQYTGLKDENGNKIFEGDIVKYGDTIHQVVFEQRNGTAYYGLMYSSIETLPFGHYQDLRQIEVIGNIYDNPELLKDGE